MNESVFLLGTSANKCLRDSSKELGLTLKQSNCALGGSIL